MRASLRILRGAQFGERIDLPDELPTSFGRSTEADRRLEGRQVSRLQFAIERGPAGEYCLRDLGSGNGTFLNGRQVDGVVQLADGDRIAAGEVECRFDCPDAAAPDRTALRLRPTDSHSRFTVGVDKAAKTVLADGVEVLGTEALFAAAAACAEARDPARLLSRLLEIGAGALGACRGGFLLIADDDPEPRVAAVRRAPEDPAVLGRAFPPAILDAVVHGGRAVQLRILAGPEDVLLAPMPAIASPGFLYLGRDLGADAKPFDPSALGGAVAIASLAAQTLDSQKRPGDTDTRHVQIRLLVEGIDDLVFILNDEGAFTYTNRCAGASDTVGGATVLGRRLADCVPLADRDDVLEVLDNVLAGGARGVLETNLHLQEGIATPVRLLLGPLRNANGAVIGVCGIARDQREMAALRRRMRKTPAVTTAASGGTHAERPPGAEAIVGSSPPMATLFAKLGRIQQHESPVLVSGETGTGKELVARAIHAGSPRSDGPFVPVNCAALPESLLEAELFGHVRGAFTGAVRTRRGLMASAHLGTLFLDEIGEMEPAMQSRLLRAIDDREIRPVGADRGQKVDIRIVVATNRDLSALVDAGRFRADLFFRLNVVQVAVPALRDRRPDIPTLIEHALALVAAEGGPVRRFDLEALAPLMAYDWPGNVRELINTVRRLALDASSEVLTLEDLPVSIRDAGLVSHATPAAGWAIGGAVDERESILQALEATGGNRKRAAALIGMPRATFYRRLTKYGIS